MKKILFTSSGLLFIGVALAALDDVRGTPASKAVQYLYEQGVVEGYDDDTFKPDQAINRAEFLKIVLEAAGKADDICLADGKYSDVSGDEWFASYVCTATQEGIIEGYPDGTFRPAQNINFAESSKIVAKVNALDTSEEDTTNWFTPFVAGLNREKVVPESLSEVDENITRGEMAQMVWGLQTGNEVENQATKSVGVVNSCRDLETQIQKFQKRQGYGRHGRFFAEPELMEVQFDGAMLRNQAMPVSSMMDDMAVEESAVSSKVAAPAPVAGQSDREYSSTNIQEFGVDEADIIKNDDTYLYLIKGNTVRIVQAYPADQLRTVANFTIDDVKSFNPRELYLDGDTLTVVGTSYGGWSEPIGTPVMPMPEPMLEPEIEDSAETSWLNFDIFPQAKAMVVEPGWRGSNESKTVLASYDVGDRGNPKLIRQVAVEGNYTSSRKIGDTVYLVSNKYNNWYYGRPVPMLRSGADLPQMTDSAFSEDRVVAPCNKVMYFPNFETANYLIVAAVDTVDTSEKVGRVMMLGSGDTVYASTENLYVTRTQYRDQFTTSADFTGWRYQPITEIYKFGLNGSEINFEAKGAVAGTVINQFAMSESGNFFRIATQVDQEGSGITILDENLKKTGEVTGIAPKENIKAVRFMGDKAYMITFLNVDPLFVIDLVPTSPKVLGELKIPGWSDYLHPIKDGYLLGLGKEVEAGAEDDDRLTPDEIMGMKLSIFDVTDLTDPKEIHKTILGETGTDSEALRNHKAMIIEPENGFLALPVNVQAKHGEKNGRYQPTRTAFNGAMVYGFSVENGFELKGKMTHYADDYWSKNERSYGNHDFNIQRVVYIGDYYYTWSPNVVASFGRNDFAKTDQLTLDPKACNQIYEESECGQQSQCRAVWREWQECYEEDGIKMCDSQREFERCEMKK